MPLNADPHYVGVEELSRRVETANRLTMERSSLELRVRDWNARPGTPTEERALRSSVDHHNDAIRAYNHSVDTYQPPARSEYDRIFRTPLHR
jgi:hypothetical protein